MRTRPFGNPGDLARALAIVYAAPAGQPHLLDFPYRLCAPAFYDDDPASNTRLWEGKDGTLLAFAAWQQVWATLDFALHPDAPNDLADAVLDWATARFAALGRERGVRLPYWCEARPDQSARRALLARHGFAPRATWHLLHLTRPLADPSPAPALPPGFALRPLAGPSEVEAYVATQRAAFESESMTVAWRRRTLSAPGRRPDLDLVIAAPDGRLAACCIVWTTPPEYGGALDLAGHVEPVAVHPDFQRLGLGRAILLGAFARLRALGATAAAIDVYDDNPAAQGLYESVGFRVAHAREKWWREF